MEAVAQTHSCSDFLSSDFTHLTFLSLPFQSAFLSHHNASEVIFFIIVSYLKFLVGLQQMYTSIECWWPDEILIIKWFSYWEYQPSCIPFPLLLHFYSLMHETLQKKHTYRHVNVKINHLICFFLFSNISKKFTCVERKSEVDLCALHSSLIVARDPSRRISFCLNLERRTEGGGRWKGRHMVLDGLKKCSFTTMRPE